MKICMKVCLIILLVIFGLPFMLLGLLANFIHGAFMLGWQACEEAMNSLVDSY